MDYWGSIAVPAETALADPERVIVPVCPGIVKRVWLFFPKGHAGTTKIRVLRFEHQVWPSNPDEWYLGDGTIIDIEENYPLTIYPFELILEGYNISTTKQHTAYVRFNILPVPREPVPTFLLGQTRPY